MRTSLMAPGTLLCVAALGVGLSLMLLSSCAPPTRQFFRIEMQTQSDDGQPLEGVRVWNEDMLLGTTTNSGRLIVDVEAAPGSQFDLRFDCPEGHSATRDRVKVPLQNGRDIPKQREDAEQTESSDDITYALALECKPMTRKATVVVRSNMANVPIISNRVEIGRTDEKGLAFLSLEVPPREVFELGLDTSSGALIRPANPDFPFVMPDHDEVFVVDQAFDLIAPPPPPAVVKKRPKKQEVHRPVRLGPGEGLWGTMK